MKTNKFKGKVLYKTPPPKSMKLILLASGSIVLSLGTIFLLWFFIFGYNGPLIDIIIVIVMGVLFIFGGILFIVMSKSIDNLRIYENGISWPNRGLIKYLNDEELFIPYLSIEKICIKPKSKYIIFIGRGSPSLSKD